MKVLLIYDLQGFLNKYPIECLRLQEIGANFEKKSGGWPPNPPHIRTIPLPHHTSDLFERHSEILPSKLAQSAQDCRKKGFFYFFNPGGRSPDPQHEENTPTTPYLRFI